MFGIAGDVRLELVAPERLVRLRHRRVGTSLVPMPKTPAYLDQRLLLSLPFIARMHRLRCSRVIVSINHLTFTLLLLS